MLTIRRMCLAEAGVLFSPGLRVEKASKRPGGGKDEAISPAPHSFWERFDTQMRALETRSLSELKVCATMFPPQFPNRGESRFSTTLFYHKLNSFCPSTDKKLLSF